MATIKDVAALARVSPTTVSRLLNNKIITREETKKRIEEAVKQLDYRPNFLARSLVTKETRTIGLVIPDIINPYFPAIARGVEDVANRRAWNVILCNSDNRPEKELTYIRVLQQKQVDGIILASTGVNKEQINAFLAEGLNLVFAGRYVGEVMTDAVIINNAEGAYQATRHLLTLGHRRIAFITGQMSIRTSQERRRGYEHALSEYGLAVDEDLIEDGKYQYQGGYLAMKRLLKRKPWPTALFAANDVMAIGAIRAVEEVGAGVPDDVAIVGFDDILLASLITPPLTTMAVSAYKMGTIAAKMLLDRATGKKAKPKIVTMEPKLVIRASCGANKSSHMEKRCMP
ncbi:MAG: LacI family transcriptional regulator [Chloroflexi bacterium]|nr:LacI family transcriptional regulator [Chloroflexota bacterium]